MARLRHTIHHMNHLTPELLAQVVRAELDATGLTEREIQRRTGISRDTLNRRIAAGDLRSRDLLRIAGVLDIPLSVLVARAEKRHAAARAAE